MRYGILGIEVDLSSSRGRFHISESELLMMLCLHFVRITLCSMCGSVLPSIRFASFSTISAPVDWLNIWVRVEWWEGK